MATSKFKLKGWNFHFDEAPVDGRRRRGRGPEEKLVLRREVDGLEVRAGETLVTTDPQHGDQLVVLVKYVDFGTDDYIVLAGIEFLAPIDVQNVPEDTHEQELFLTAVTRSVYCENILHKAHVLGEEDFAKISTDDSNRDSVFLCRRGYDTFYNAISAPISIASTCQTIAQDHDKGFAVLKKIVVKAPGSSNTPPPASSVVTSSSHTSPRSPNSAPSSDSETTRRVAPKKRSMLPEVVLSDSDSDENKAADSDDIFSDDSQEPEILADDDELFKPRSNIPTGRPRGRPRKHPCVERSDPVVKRPRGRPRKHPIAEAGSRRSYVKKSQLQGPKSLALQRLDDDELTESSMDSKFDLPCRENQFADLYLAIEGAIQTGSGTCVYVSGVPGTGKTATVREVVRELYRESQEGDVDKFDYLEINGMKLLTAQSAYEILYNKISTGRRLPNNGFSSALEHYFESGEAEKPLVVLMDELDQVATKSQAVIYNFFNWPTFPKSKFIVIAVANTMDLPERALTNKTSSRLGLVRFQFPSYKHEELVEIIKSRFGTLLNNEVEVKLKDDAVEFAARKVASVSGDARRALKICERAIEIAKESAKEDEAVMVQTLHINKAVLESTSAPIQQYIADLSLVAKFFLGAFLSKKRKSGLAENSLGDVIDEIKQIVSLNTSKSKDHFVIDNVTVLDIMYKDFLVRPRGIDYILNELSEAGVILVLRKDSVRNSLVKLDVADTEVTSVFKKDKSFHVFADMFTDGADE